MAEVSYDVDAAPPARVAAASRVREVPDPQFPTKIPAGRRSSTLVPPVPGGQSEPTPEPAKPKGDQTLCMACLLGAISPMLAPGPKGPP
ncbi:MAG: hypothetical protein M3Y48_15175 [Actinomycetota bacterium]|nr:hypothetical protein [Actinomycetota bacterium]